MSDQETRVAEWAARKEQDARIGRAVFFLFWVALTLTLMSVHGVVG